MTKTPATCTIYVDSSDPNNVGLAYRVTDGDREESGAIGSIEDISSIAHSLDEGAEVIACAASGRRCDIFELLLEQLADTPDAFRMENLRDRRYAASLIDAAVCGEPYAVAQAGDAAPASVEWIQSTDLALRSDERIITEHASYAAGMDADAYEANTDSLDGIGLGPEGDHDWWADLADALDREPTEDEQSAWLRAYADAIRALVAL